MDMFVFIMYKKVAGKQLATLHFKSQNHPNPFNPTTTIDYSTNSILATIVGCRNTL